MKTFCPTCFFRSYFGIVLIILLFTGSVFITKSCTEPEGIGLDLIDDKALFKRTDTVSIVSFVERADSVPGNLDFQNLLGLMHDPHFGKTRASIVAEFRLPANNLSLGQQPVLDSIVLSFHYTGQYYGNIETFQTIKVYELQESLPQSGVLYSNHPVIVNPVPIGQRVLRPAPADSTLIDTVFFAPHFFMRLSDSFGQKIIDANGTEHFRNVQTFLDYFKGLKITVEDNFTEGGAIFNINMFGQFTTLRLHYHDAADTARTPIVQHFQISNFAQRLTKAEHFDFVGSNPLITSSLANPGLHNDSLLFLKSLGGLHTRIRLPYIDDLAAMPNVTINQAKLILPVEEQFIQENFGEAAFLHLYHVNDQGEFQALIDSQLGEDFFGGAYNATSRQYEFNITMHLQEVIRGTIPNNDLILMVSGGASNAERIVLRGPGRSANPMRLQIIYSSFN
ncbi:MAG TPA: DUF4270 family protein [Bacteroidales bacterium]|nr:DUF4270 family protein [Bacteroidales bacterium]